jgi:glycosyltransferase involved in cell wall biosynthesis
MVARVAAGSARELDATERYRRLMPAKKKILVFIDWFLPGYRAGGPVRSCANLIDHLKGEYDFSVVTRDTDYCETQPYTSVKSDQWNMLPNGVRVYYFSASRLNGKNIRELMKQEQYDAVYLNGIYSPYFTLVPLRYAKKMNKPVVMAARGMLAGSALAVKSTKKKVFLSFVKLTGLFNNVLFHATTASEADDIRAQFGNNVKIAPNLPRKQNDENLHARKKEKGSARIVNIARIAPEKNLEYALQVLVNVKANIEFDFYGPVYDATYWEKCRALMDAMPSNVNVSYRDSVDAEKIAETLNNYHFMFMPTRGENFGHIILESLASGCPVIISDQTPWRNLEEKRAGWDISLSNMKQFTNVIERCAAMDQQEYNEWSKDAFDYAAGFLYNEEIIRQNKELFM